MDKNKVLFKEDSLKLEYVSITDKKPSKKEGKFVYKIIYKGILSGKKNSGGTIEVEIISPRKITKEEIRHQISFTTQMITSLISTQYEILEEVIKDVDKIFEEHRGTGFFGFGEPKINFNGKNLTKEEFFYQEIKDIIKMNTQMKVDLIIKGTKMKKIIKFKNFNLAFSNMGDLDVE